MRTHKQLLFIATAMAMGRGVECANARELRTFPVRVAAQQLEQQSHVVLSQLHEIPLAVFLCPVNAQRVCVCRRKLRWRETEPPACFRLGCCTTLASVSQGGASPNPQSRSHAKFKVLFRTTNVYCEYKESLHSSVHRQHFVQQSDIAMRQPSNVKRLLTNNDNASTITNNDNASTIKRLLTNNDNVF
jgi:hypothetical protein